MPEANREEYQEMQRNQSSGVAALNPKAGAGCRLNVPCIPPAPLGVTSLDSIYSSAFNTQPRDFSLTIHPHHFMELLKDTNEN